MRRAGLTSAQASARLGAVTRRRNLRSPPPTKKKRRAVPPVTQPKKRRASSKPPTKKRRAAAKPPSKPPSKKTRRAAAKPPASLAPPKKRRARVPAPRPRLLVPPPPTPPELPPARRRRPELSPAAEAAITRAERLFLALPVPRPFSRLAQVETYERRRQQYIETMRRAGLTEAQIRARLAVVTRRRNELRRYIREEIRVPALGTLRELHGSNLRERAELQTRMIERDDSFLTFMEAMDDLGIGYDEAINSWFSP